MSNDLQVLVFAYGSNLHLQRMRSRVPSAEPISIGFVAGRRLRFHKRSVDGSAKADAKQTSESVDRVWGAVYRMDARHKLILDQYEFLGTGYDEEIVTVSMPGGESLNAWMYVAREESIAESLLPYDWYLNYVIQGAYQQRLPFCYLAALHLKKTKQDPDQRRCEENTKQLAEYKEFIGER